MDIDKEFRLSVLALTLFAFLAAGGYLYLWQSQEDPLVYHNTVLLGGGLVLSLLGIAALVFLFFIFKSDG